MNNTKNFSSNEENEIDLLEVWESICRRKLHLLSITSLSLITGVAYTFISKPVWEGSFQIVLRDQPSKTMEASSSISKSIVKNSGLQMLTGPNGLRTEVEILKSPSVLKSVYDYIKLYKKESGENVSKWTFYSWKDKNLKVELKKKTSVLNLKYNDNDKNLIIPVLKKISSKYQAYSRSTKEKNLLQNINYLNNQIVRMKDQSRSSLNKLQSFSLQNGLGNRDGLPISLDKLPNKKENNIGDNLIITNIEQFNEEETIDRYESTFKKLSLLESELVEKSSFLKPNSEYIIVLNKRIKNLKKSLSKDPEVLLNYRELKNKALRDEMIYVSLQNNLSNIKLQKARQINSWDLISQPTLIDEPIAPKKTMIIGLSLIIGLGLGSLFALLIDKSSDRIYSLKYLKERIKYPLLKTFTLKSMNWNNSINLLYEKIKVNSNGSIAIVPVGENFNLNQINLLKDAFRKIPNVSEIIVSKDLIKTSKCNSQLLIFAPGSCTYQELVQIEEDLSMQNGNTFGWIYIDN